MITCSVFFDGKLLSLNPCLIVGRAELEHPAELAGGRARRAYDPPGVGVRVDHLEKQRQLQAQAVCLGAARTGL